MSRRVLFATAFCMRQSVRNSNYEISKYSNFDMSFEFRRSFDCLTVDKVVGLLIQRVSDDTEQTGETAKY